MQKFLFTILLVFLMVYPVFSDELKWEPDRFGVATSEKDSQATIFDIKTNSAVKSVKTGKVPHPLAFTPDGKKLYIANRGECTLTVVDMMRFEAVKTIKLNWKPSCVAVSHNGKLLAVTAKEESEVAIIDTATDEIVKSIPILRTDNEENESRQKPLHGMTMTHPIWTDDDMFLYVNIVPKSMIIKLDGRNFDLVSTIQTPSPIHMMYEHDNRLYALAQGKRMMNRPPGVVIYDIKTDKKVAYTTIPLQEGEPPLGHHACFAGDIMYYANMGNDSAPWGSTVALLDIKLMKGIKTLEGPTGAGHPLLSPDGKYVFVSGHGDNRIFVIDTKTQEITKKIRLGEKKGVGHGCFFSPDGKRYYIVSNADNAVYVIDAEKLETIAKIPTGEFPNDMSLNFMDSYK